MSYKVEVPFAGWEWTRVHQELLDTGDISYGEYTEVAFHVIKQKYGEWFKENEIAFPIVADDPDEWGAFLTFKNVADATYFKLWWL